MGRRRAVGHSRTALAVFCLLAIFAISGCSNSGSAASPEPASPGTAAVPKAAPSAPKPAPKPHRRPGKQPEESTKLLAKLPIRAEADGSGYRRASFETWIEQRGCSTRQDVLRSEDRAPVGSACQLRRGRWLSAYDGETIRNPADLDIDHFVPVKQAYVSGAWHWNLATRRRFANDLGYSGSLRAVSATSNRSKGDSDPAQWMPPREAFRCRYVGTWIAVKYRWQLSIDPTERQVLKRYVAQCGKKANVPVPRRATVMLKRKVKRRPASGGPGHPAGSNDRRYSTCAEAIAHGLGPYRRGSDPEYSWYRDGNDNGVDCER